MTYKVKSKPLKEKLKRFKAVIYGEDMYGKPFKKTIYASGTNPRKVYTSIKQDNAVTDILSFEEI